MFVATRAMLNDHEAVMSVDHVGATHPLMALGKIGLIQQSLNFTVDTLLATVAAIEANYNTYARVNAFPFSAVFVAALGMSLVEAANFHIQMTDALKPQSIFGAFLVDTTGAILLGGELFPAPIPLATALDAFDYILRWGFLPNINNGIGLVG